MRENASGKSGRRTLLCKTKLLLKTDKTLPGYPLRRFATSSRLKSIYCLVASVALWYASNVVRKWVTASVDSLSQVVGIASLQQKCCVLFAINETLSWLFSFYWLFALESVDFTSKWFMNVQICSCDVRDSTYCLAFFRPLICGAVRMNCLFCRIKDRLPKHVACNHDGGCLYYVLKVVFFHSTPGSDALLEQHLRESVFYRPRDVSL